VERSSTRACVLAQIAHPNPPSLPPSLPLVMDLANDVRKTMVEKMRKKFAD